MAFRRDARGKVSASPVPADGKIFAINEAGVTTVLAAKPALEILAANTLDAAMVMATPVVAGNRIYIRGASHLYRIGRKKQATEARPRPRGWPLAAGVLRILERRLYSQSSKGQRRKIEI